MATNISLPKREAIVLVNGEPSLNFDPIHLPVELSSAGLMADVFSSDLLRLVDALCALDSATFRYSLVWSDGESNVMGMCPLCDKPFPVAEGAPGDVHNEGVNAVTCGCWNG